MACLLSLFMDDYRYYVSFINECTGFVWLYPLHNKFEVFAKFVHVYALVSNHFSASIKFLQSDVRGEYVSKTFTEFLSSTWIVHQLSCPYTPQQNGLAERKLRHLVETSLTLMTVAALPTQFWFHATAHDVFLINCMPVEVLVHQSP